LTTTAKPAVGLLALFGLLAALVAARAALQVTQGLQGEYLLDSSSAPVLTVITPQVSTGQITADWNGSPPPAFRARWFGYLMIGRSRQYSFATSSDDGSTLAIDGKVVVDNGGVHGLQTQTGRVRLEPGSHFVLIEYIQSGGDYSLSWSWAAEGGELSRVPAWVLSPKRLSYRRALVANILDQLALAVLVLFGLAVSWLAVKYGQTPAWRAARQHPRFASFALFVTLALVETWPLATNPAHLSRNDNADTVLNEWTLAWVVHQAPRAPLRLYEANIFYPEHDTLAYSEAMIVQSAMAAPLFQLGASAVLAYNLVLLAGFVLTGWAVTLVVVRWTGDWVAGLVSGILAGFNAHTLSRLPHLQAQHAEFLPLALVALDALFREPRTGHALRLAGWFTLQALASVYLLVFTAFALTAAALARPDAWMSERFGRVSRFVALAAGLAALALLPFMLPYWRAYHDQGLTRSLVEAGSYSASPGDYLATPARLHWAWWSYRWTTRGTALFPGALGLTLTCIAILTGVAFRDARARMCLAMGVCGVLLSFGPTVPGYAFLYRFVPMLHAVRTPVRFGYLGIVAVAILAGFGVVELRRRLPIRIWPPLAAIILVMGAIEPLAAPLELSAFDDIPRIYARVPPDPDAVVVELPFPSSHAMSRNAKYMLNSTRHWKPMLNGYSGFVPDSYYQHVALLEGFPSAESLAVLQGLKVTYLFVHVDAYGPRIVPDLERVPALTAIAAEGPIVLYRLRGIQ
jgi:PA14 domain-containing protein